MSQKRDRTAWIRGGAVCCEPSQKPEGRIYRLVLLGAPGVGKGTQAELLTEKLGACHLSTGDIFRAAKSLPDGQRSPALEDALGYMRRGDLVPDQTVLDLVRERVACLRCPCGFLLDGFPRTLPQAEALTDTLQREQIVIDAVLNYEMPIETIVARLSGRRTCTQCKAIFHAANKPTRVEGVCDHCGGKVIQREDDRPESVRVRMEVYEKSTKPLIDYYSQRGLLVTIPSEGKPAEVFQRAMARLDSAQAKK